MDKWTTAASDIDMFSTRISPELEPVDHDDADDFSGDSQTNRDEGDSPENPCKGQVTDEKERDVLVRRETPDDYRNGQCERAHCQR